MRDLRAFIGFIHFVYVSAISSLKSKSTALGKNYGEFLLSYAIGSTNYLLVSEGGINLGIDIYKVTSTTVTKEQTHSSLATATYGYVGFAQDGTNLFVIAGSSNYVYSIYAYTLSSLSSGTISSLSAPFTLNGHSYSPSISATYSSSTGYVAFWGGQKVSVCKYTSSPTSCAATSWTLSYGASIAFGVNIAFAPGTTTLAVSDTSTGSNFGSIYLYDVSSSTAPTAFKTFSSTTQDDYLGALLAISPTTLYAFCKSPQNVYSFTISGTSTNPTSTVSIPTSSASIYGLLFPPNQLVLSVDGGTLALSDRSTLTTLAVSSDGTITSKNKFSITGSSSLAATPDFVFVSNINYNSNDGEVFVFANTASPVAKPNNDLAIGLGVGLGGGAAIGAGAGVFYYVKGLHAAAAHKVAAIAEPVADSIELA